MTCFDFEIRVQELLDRRQSELPAELSAHATHCAACGDLWERFQRLQTAVVIWQTRSPTMSLADAVLQRLQGERQSTANPQVFTTRPACSPLAGFVVLMASAATLLTALGIGWRVSSNTALANRKASSATSLVANHSDAVTSSALATDRELDALLHDARDAYVALASQAWQDVSIANMLLPPAEAATPFSGDELAPNVPETLSRPLAPFGAELRDAVDSLLQQVFHSQDSST